MADPVSFAVSTAFSFGMSFLFPSEGPRLKDLKVSASTYGAPIPEGFGTVRVGANMIWSNPIKERKKKKMQGKGGGFYNEYTYYADFAMAFCAGPITAFRRIWADGKLIYDATGASEVKQPDKYRFRLYLGDEDQLPDALIIAAKGEGNTPAYRGLAYVVFEDMALKDFGNRIPQMAAEVYVANSSEVPGVTGVPLTQFEDSSISNNRLTAVLADYDRGNVFIQVNESGGLPGGLMRMRMSDGGENLEVAEADMNLPGAPTAWHNPDQINGLLAVAANGSVLLSNGGLNNYQVIAKIDGSSLRAVDSWGSSHPFGPDLEDWQYVKAPRGKAAVIDHHVCIIGRVGNGPTTAYVFNTAAGPLLSGSTEHFETGDLVEDLPYLKAVAGGKGAEHFYGISATGALSDTITINSIALTGNLNDPCYPLGAGTALSTFSLAAEGVVHGTFPAEIVAALWDVNDPGVILAVRSNSSRHYLIKWSADLEAPVWTLEVQGLPVSGFGQSNLLTGELAWVTNTRYYLVDTVNGKFIDRDADSYVDGTELTDDFDDGSEGIPIEAGLESSYQLYDSLRATIITSQNLVRVSAVVSGTSLATIVQRVLIKAGLTSANYDLTALESVPVRGYGWASNSDAKSILEGLKRVYLFDLVESNGQLVASLRSQEPTAETLVISQNVLGSSGPEAMDFWSEKRLSEADLPERITLSYMNVDDDFETSTAISQRISAPLPTMFSRQQAAFEMSLVLTPTEAKNLVNKMLYAQWSERTQHTTRLPWAYLDLDPSDLVKVQMNDGRTYIERVHQTEFGANFAIEMETYGQDSGAYESDMVGDGGGAGRVDTITVSMPALPVVLNTPLLRDTDDTGGGSSRYYSGVAQDGNGSFGGATLFRSINDQDYETLFSDDVGVEWGSVPAATPPASHGAGAVDWETQITIFPGVSWFDLESITDDELWAGANLCVIGQEVIQFRDAVQNADGSWTISNLLRGRRGTEYACDTHTSGERFYFLSNTSIAIQGDVITARGQDRFFKAVAEGRSLNNSSATQINYEPRDLMPYAVGDIQRVLDTDITVSWSRCTRLGGNMVDGTGDVPLGEAFEAYEVYLLDAAFDGDLSRGNPPPEYRRKYEVTSPQITYTAAEQTADGYVADIDTLHVVVYQLSAAVGRGFPSPRSIEHWRDA